MEKILPLEEHTINMIYRESHDKQTYVIPVYQRNYAWQENEITALIKDVYDSMHKSPNAPYYIGTLVTYNRGDNKYEVIDGQQRLTTIYIILKALGVKNIKNDLTYSARKASASTIQKLDSYPKLGDEVDGGISKGYEYATKGLGDIVSESEKESFTKYFLNNVHIIHYNVPKDVDLNHYFEVMNSRGEQLEKHEIVKSMLGQYLKDGKNMAKFSRIWEACCEMNIYIQQVFDDKNVFGYNLSNFNIQDFDDIPEQNESEGKSSIKDLLNGVISKIDESASTDKSDKFQPIIDFPNFLLIVLKLTRMLNGDLEASNFVLDDKELFNEFKEALDNYNTESDKAEFAKQFAFNLLKAKYFLDNYIVHHSLNDQELPGDNPWKLQYYYQETTKKRYPKNLASLDVQNELVHLLSMFEVTFTPKQRKNYLFFCMLYLFESNRPTEENYLQFLQALADKYFYGVYMNSECLNERNQPRPNAFDSILLTGRKLNVSEPNYKYTDYQTIFNSIYKQGNADIPLFVFNYTDYILWRKYSVEMRGNKTKKGSVERNAFFNELGCSDFGLDVFDNFYFSRTRKSLEHYYPQAKAGEDKAISAEEINCFGNFAMIGAEANSSGSDWDPKTKLDHYCDSKSDQVSVASLKFKIMMQMCQDNIKDSYRDSGMEWNAEDMQKHQQKMLHIVVH